MWEKILGAIKTQIKTTAINTWEWIKHLHIPTKQEIIDFSNEWFPRDAKYIKVKSEKQFSIQTVLVVFVTAASLFLVVFSSVFISYQERQVMALEDKLKALQEEAKFLEDILVVKNDPILLSQKAKDMGMISKAYVEYIYEPEYVEEKIIVYTTKNRGIKSFVDVVCELGLIKK